MIAESTLYSNSGSGLMHWKVFDFHEEAYAIEVRCEASTVIPGAKKPDGGGDAFQIVIPQIVCGRLSMEEFVRELTTWARMPLENLSASDFQMELDLRFTDYAFRDRFTVEVRAPEADRSIGDQRHFQATWESSFTTLSWGFTIDATGANEFCSRLPPNVA